MADTDRPHIAANRRAAIRPRLAGRLLKRQCGNFSCERNPENETVKVISPVAIGSNVGRPGFPGLLIDDSLISRHDLSAQG